MFSVNEGYREPLMAQLVIRGILVSYMIKATLNVLLIIMVASDNLSR